MTIVEEYIQVHSGREWFRVFRIPIIAFAVFELLLLAIMTLGHESKMIFALRDVGIFNHWLYALIFGTGCSILGMLTRQFKSLCKYHVTSTAQLMNAITWGVAGFAVLDTTDENALAIGLLFLSVINVFFAIIDERWGDQKIKV